jgi:hypothetical protein
LRGKKEVTEGFGEKRKGLSWAAQVEPLLDFNPSYKLAFATKLQILHANLSNQTAGPLFSELVTILEMAIAQLTHELDLSRPPPVKLASPSGDYVNQSRIAELRAIKNNNFDLTRLIQMCSELNSCHRAANLLSIIMLCRAIIDHVPPIFGMNTFNEVANNYGAGGRSFKESMERLNVSSRKIADQHLHTPIRDKEVLPTITQVDFSNELDVLLGEVVRILKH